MGKYFHVSYLTKTKVKLIINIYLFFYSGKNIVFFIVDCGGSGDIRNMTGRRTKLPCPKPDTEGLSLWNLLCKNIGKDLSQVSMPVALNEPLNMLQVNI